MSKSNEDKIGMYDFLCASIHTSCAMCGEVRPLKDMSVGLYKGEPAIMCSNHADEQNTVKIKPTNDAVFYREREEQIRIITSLITYDAYMTELGLTL